MNDKNTWGNALQLERVVGRVDARNGQSQKLGRVNRDEVAFLVLTRSKLCIHTAKIEPTGKVQIPIKFKQSSDLNLQDDGAAIFQRNR